MDPAGTIGLARGSNKTALTMVTGNVYVPIVSGSSNICSTFGGSDANGCIAVITSQSGWASEDRAAIAPASRTSAVSGTLGTPSTAFASVINAAR